MQFCIKMQKQKPILIKKEKKKFLTKNCKNMQALKPKKFTKIREINKLISLGGRGAGSFLAKTYKNTRSKI